MSFKNQNTINEGLHKDFRLLRLTALSCSIKHGDIQGSKNLKLINSLTDAEELMKKGNPLFFLDQNFAKFIRTFTKNPAFYNNSERMEKMTYFNELIAIEIKPEPNTVFIEDTLRKDGSDFLN